VLKLLISIFTFILIAALIAFSGTEILWFDEVDYISSLLIRWQTQIIWFLFTFSLSALFLFGNLRLTEILLRKEIEEEIPNLPEFRKLIATQRDLIHQSPAINLSLLLPTALSVCLLIAVIFFYYGQALLDIWQAEFILPKLTPLLPSTLDLIEIRNFIDNLIQQIWKLIPLTVLVFFVLLQIKFASRSIALILSLIFGLVMSGNWMRILQYFNPISFDRADPEFNLDIGFYIFKLPLWEIMDFWFGGLFLYALAACFLNYLLANNSLSEGKFSGLTRSQLRHIYALMAMVTATLALRHWLNRYELLYSQRGVTYGASYTDVNIQLPLEMLLTFLSTIITIWLLYKAITGSSSLRKTRTLTIVSKPLIPVPLIPFIIYMTVLIGGICMMDWVQRFDVQPNELERETEFISRSIKSTRTAFALDAIETKTFDPQNTLTEKDLIKNHLTIDNIRLWDTRPLMQTNRQLQQIRLYYRFADADIDRYTFKVGADSIANRLDNNLDNNNLQETIIDDRQQVLIAPRELDYNSVPDSAKTWVNKHLVYTHGYGFTLSPVNKVDGGGLPYYFVKDIGTAKDPGDLQTSNPLIRETIPINKPRIYYGELTDNYIMISTKVRELDFPSGDDNAYNTYDGSGGIAIDSRWKRLIFATYLKDWQMLFTKNFTAKTKLLMRRKIIDRVKAIAPFLDYDADPYLIVADNPDQAVEKNSNHLYWILDAYTNSERYPYSDPGKNRFNYIRNSVKVVIDAYNGDITFYISDRQDPIVQSWQKIFPDLFQEITTMQPQLRSHIRYPEDLFRIQSERLLTYHMIDPQVFYNREDQWQIPTEIYGSESQPVEPYYLIMRLPTEKTEEFILLSPYTPTSRPNLIAWLAARSDDQQYGRLLLYTFPKEKLIFGPDQIEALINQNPTISQQISLWNRAGSKAIQGNLLIIPIEQSLLYVEPLYLEAEKNSLPTLARVIVVYKNQIVMAENLPEALQRIFASRSPKSSTTN
jgi:hypothetical protein